MAGKNETSTLTAARCKDTDPAWRILLASYFRVTPSVVGSIKGLNQLNADRSMLLVTPGMESVAFDFFETAGFSGRFLVTKDGVFIGSPVEVLMLLRCRQGNVLAV
ncbi:MULTISPECIES: hypothetical protein [unclassified Mesorhizobium]|uniref:hypothetical protein n=1 Tax=unclassified Mesorhizobium TaxID=325217 RepID=UPI001CCC0063|nr:MULTISPECIES: hypothetical protein [unclassified Mesorhizobium]MBZ9859780.1 hypothetical protein [Mesorhizobium sp. CA12]MBZ9915597.1 hypothetical protein [Mesorhizobium sp. CA16]